MPAQWIYQPLETVNRLVCKCVKQLGDRIVTINCQQVRCVKFDYCSVYRTIEPRSRCRHGLNINHSLLPHKDSLKDINRQMLHSRADRTKLGAHQENIVKKKRYRKFSHGIHFCASRCIRCYFQISVFSQGPVS